MASPFLLDIRRRLSTRDDMRLLLRWIGDDSERKSVQEMLFEELFDGPEEERIPRSYEFENSRLLPLEFKTDGTRLSSDGEKVFVSYRNADNHHRNLLNLREGSCRKEALPQEQREKISICQEKDSTYKKVLTEDTENNQCRAARKKKRHSLDGLENPRCVFPELKTLPIGFSFDREDIFMFQGNADDHHGKIFSIVWQELCRKEALHQEQRMSLDWKTVIPIKTNCQMTPLRDFGECPRSHHLPALSGSEQMKQMNGLGNRFSLDNNESCVFIDYEFTQPLDRDGKRTSHLKDNSTSCDLNKHKETMPGGPELQFEDTFNQHKRKETAQRVSSAVVLTITSLGLFLDIWSLLSSLMKVQPLHKERGPVSIWPSLLRLSSFTVFVWAVAIMILVGAPFTRLHRAILIFWAVMMHVRSANSISAAYVPILGALFMG